MMATPAEHIASKIETVDGWFQVVTCSCTDASKPTTHTWARDHFEGSLEDGWAVLESVFAKQKAARHE